MNEIEIRSISDYIKITEAYKGEHYFRGQANKKWEVQPHIFINKAKLENETVTLDIEYTKNNLNALSKILQVQHYGSGTRLCDLTVNPLVALYFAIEDNAEDDADSCVFVFDKSNDIAINSNIMQIMLLLTVENIRTICDLEAACELHGIEINRHDLSTIIQNNYIVNYDVNLSYSNKRAFLQGGTGISFGFELIEEEIYRKGRLTLPSMVQKIIIPKENKQKIRDFLRNFGICKELLYDSLVENRKLSYYIEEKIENKPLVTKVFLNIKVSDIAFVGKDILDMVEEIFQKYMYSAVRVLLVFGYIFYDEQDKRNYNWIAMPQIKDSVFTLKYNSDYHKRRMDYMNKEITIRKIVSLTEPIMKICFEAQQEVSIAFNELALQQSTIADYQNRLKSLRCSLQKTIYFDLQDIEHGASQYDNYYNYSNSYCISVDELIEHQVIDSNLQALEYILQRDLKNCNAYFLKYKSAYDVLEMD